jgi:outer membrane translocation and assembly module TamA
MLARVSIAGLSLALLVPHSALAQALALQTPSEQAETTAAEIDILRKQKQQRLRTEQLPWLHRAILSFRESRIPEKLTYGYKGLRPRFGTLGPGSGFGAGIEYFRPNLSNERFTVRSSVTASPLQFFMVDGEFEARRIAGKGSVNVLAFHRLSPSIDFYGVGNTSSLVNLTAYSLEENNVQVTGAWQLLPRLRAGGFGRYFTANVGRTRQTNRISTETIFQGREVPGLGDEAPYVSSGAFLELVPNLELGAPPGGTRASVRWSRFFAQQAGIPSFTSFEAFAERQQMFLNQQRAVVLRARASLNEPDGQNSIPFYLQPQLGGPNDLRGFAGRRFYDNNLVIATAEYQWQIFSGAWLAVFSDTGKVFPRWDNWSVRGLRTSYGVGLRFGGSGMGAGRFDFAWSKEGSQFWVVFATF